MELPDLVLNLSAADTSASPSPDTVYDLIILGAGPAAMSAAVYAARKRLDMAILCRSFGGQVADSSIIENYLGFQSISAAELVKIFEKQVRSFDIPIGAGIDVKKVGKDGEVFRILTGGAAYRAKTVIACLGKRARPLGVPGETRLLGKGVAYCATCDAPFFADKKVFVVGGGNSAATSALDLAKFNADVTLMHSKDSFSADPVLIDAVEKTGKVSILTGQEITAINGQANVESVEVRDIGSGETKTEAADGVFIEIGLVPNSEPVAQLVELNESGEIIVDCSCRTATEGLFAAGDVTTAPYKQIVISAGEGAKAALAAYDYLARSGGI